MCGGGDGGIGQQRELEAERQAGIRKTIDAIDAVYRDPANAVAYDRYEGAVNELNQRELDRQYGNAGRAVNFQLARQGLGGGSSAIDQSAELQRQYEQGVIQAAQKAESASNELRAGDERARLGLISQAQAGLDATTGTQNAIRQIELANRQANTSAQANTLGESFGGLGNSLLSAAQNQGANQARLPDYARTATPSPTSPNYRPIYQN
ncbi:MAG: hypothetical protein ACR2RL_21810 [Gammaproteobacteria bacterium]